ncbi:MAG TPA: type II toxin-antitoxin system HicB family antitoxin [Xanthobacteraceae bacterium]|nr:type II toxin-antitoxin system HicB family antitoxin [Xanthobacteraceae bacterium]
MRGTPDVALRAHPGYFVNAMRKLEYPITLRPLANDEGGGWLAEFPDLPGCMADGAMPEEAMREAADAARSWIRTAKVHGDPIPPPSRADRPQGG